MSFLFSSTTCSHFNNFEPTFSNVTRKHVQTILYHVFKNYVCFYINLKFASYELFIIILNIKLSLTFNVNITFLLRLLFNNFVAI